MDVLVATILSQNTNRANSSAGLERLRKRFATWDDVADARPAAIERCIRVSGLSRTKAPRIRKILLRLRADRGQIDLGYLAELPAEQAYRELLAFEGVGSKTALCVLMFALGLPVFPVDTHVFRIMDRLGVLPAGATPQRAHEALTPLIAPADCYEMHVLLIAHGRAVCRARRPQCPRCTVRPLCRYAGAPAAEA